MTTIKADKPLRRETDTIYRRRALVIELGPRTITIREKGRRSGVSVSYDAVYDLGRKLEWKKLQAEKAKKKGKGK